MNGAAQQLVYNRDLKTASNLLRACTHPLRLQLISYIDKNKSINVNNIYQALKLEQSVASQHLKILRDANLVLTIREGKFIFYSLNYELLEQIADSTQKYFSLD